MRKLLAVGVFSLLLSGCGGSGGGSAPAEGSQKTDNINQVCFLGAKSDYKTCLAAKPFDAVAYGYLDPYTDKFMGTGDKSQYRRPKRAVVLKDYSQNLKLSPHFIMSEIMNSARDSIGIFAPAVVDALQKLRNLAMSSIRVNSSFRSPKYNSGVSGAAVWSRHQYGDAFDISSSKLSLNQMENLCKQLGATYTDKYEVHVHCDWRDVDVPEAFYGASQNSRVTTFSIEDLEKEMSETSVLHMSGDVVKGNVVYLSSEVQFQDDAEELYKKWEIITPSGQRLTYESSTCSLLLESGRYHIRHSIGSHAVVTQYFDVP